MSLAEWSWLALAAYAVHILEEYTFDWRSWARTIIGLPVEWSDFYVTNAVVIVLGIVQGELASTLVFAPLSFASLMLVNATFFHVLPFVRTGGRFSPGLVTAVALFYPVGLSVFRCAWSEGHLEPGVTFAALLVGAALMAFPIIMLNLRSKRYFRQT